MKIFLDTADRAVIERLLATGLVDGVTTNPTLMSKQGGDIQKIALEICAMVKGPVSVEVVETDPEKAYEQAVRMAKSAPNVVVKIPCAQEYFSVIKRLADQGIKVNVTLVFTPLQAMMVAKLGAAYISPFVGRLDDSGVDGIAVLANIVALKKTYGLSSQILAASIRSVEHWEKAALAGADVVTLPPAVLEQAIKHPLTERGIKLFEDDWNKLDVADFWGQK